MIRVLFRPEGKPFRADLGPADLPACLRQAGGLLWLDLHGVPDDEAEPLLREIFAFHPLSIDDALTETHTPRLDDWGRYLFIVLRCFAIEDDAANNEITAPELDIFLGENYLVTYHGVDIPAVERVWAICQRDDRHLVAGPEHILYRLADEIVTDELRFLELVDDRVDVIEEQLFTEPTDRILVDLFGLKRSLLTMRRHLSPQREVLNKLARDQYAVVDAAERVFFRDVYDHLVRLVDLTESLRDLVGGAMETYLSVMNNRMNDIMKTLTVITTLFMPLTFITGFFGMNFFEATAGLAGWTSAALFAAILAGMLVMPLFMVLWMRRRAWM